MPISSQALHLFSLTRTLPPTILFDATSRIYTPLHVIQSFSNRYLTTF